MEEALKTADGHHDCSFSAPCEALKEQDQVFDSLMHANGEIEGDCGANQHDQEGPKSLSLLVFWSCSDGQLNTERHVEKNLVA